MNLGTPRRKQRFQNNLSLFLNSEKTARSSRGSLKILAPCPKNFASQIPPTSPVNTPGITEPGSNPQKYGKHDLRRYLSNNPSSSPSTNSHSSSLQIPPKLPPIQPSKPSYKATICPSKCSHNKLSSYNHKSQQLITNYTTNHSLPPIPTDPT